MGTQKKELLVTERLDPRWEIHQAFAVLRTSFESKNFRLRAYGSAFDNARKSVDFLLWQVYTLNQLPFWQSLNRCKTWPEQFIADPSPGDRQLSIGTEMARMHDVSLENIIGAMDVARRVVGSMVAQLESGTPRGDWKKQGTHPRRDVLLCAAVLPAMKVCFDNDWMDLREQIFHANRKRLEDMGLG